MLTEVELMMMHRRSRCCQSTFLWCALEFCPAFVVQNSGIYLKVVCLDIEKLILAFSFVSLKKKITLCAKGPGPLPSGPGRL